MRKIFLSALVLAGAFFLAPSARAQYTTVSGTVQDPNGIPYANGTITAVLTPATPGGYRLNGQPYSGFLGISSLDTTGNFSVSMGDVGQITPSGAQWSFTVCSNPGGIPLPLGTGNQCFTPAGITITGATQSISSQLQAAAPKLTNFLSGSGTVIGVSGILPILSSGGTSPAISCPTCVVATSGGSISLAATQVGFGTATNAIGGSNNFVYVPTSGGLGITTSNIGPTNVTGAAIYFNNSMIAGGGTTAYIVKDAQNNFVFRNDSALISANGEMSFGGNGDFFLTAGSNGPQMQLNATMHNGFGEGSVFFGLEDTGTGDHVFLINGGLTNAALSYSIDTLLLKWTGGTSGTAAIGVNAVAGSPCNIILPVTSPTAGQFLSSAAPSDGNCQVSWATVSGGGGISGLTTGFLPKASSSTSLANSLCDEGITTANVFTCTDSGGASFLAAVKTTGYFGAGSGATSCAAATGCVAMTEGTTAGTPASGQVYMRGDSTQNAFLCSLNGASEKYCDPTIPSSATSGHLVSWGTWPAMADSGVVAANVISNPMTTLGDTIYGGASGVPTRLAGLTTPNLVSQFLCETPTASAAVAPVWCETGIGINPQSGTSYTFLAKDRAALVTANNSGAQAYSLPQAGVAPFDKSFWVTVANIGSGTLTVTPTISPINGGSSSNIPPGWGANIYSDSVSGGCNVNGCYAASIFPTIFAFPNSPTNALGFNSSTGIIGSITALTATTVVASSSVAAGTAPAVCGSATGCVGLTEASTAATPTAGQDSFRADSVSHTFLCSMNNAAEGACGFTQVNSGVVNPVSVLVGSLPAAAAGNKGWIKTVSDSTTVAVEGQTCAGSSTNTALAFSNGTVWKCF